MLNATTQQRSSTQKLLVLGSQAPASLLRGLAEIRATDVVHVDGFDDAVHLPLTDVDAVLCVGGARSGWLEPALEKISQAAPRTRLLIALENSLASRELAVKYRGVALPWPLHVPSLQAYLTNINALELPVDNRRDIRHKIWAPCGVEHDGRQYSSVAVNLSERGALVLTEAPLSPGAETQFTVSFGHAIYHLHGEVRHATRNLAPLSHHDQDPMLLPPTGRLVGVRLAPECEAEATILCERIRQERESLLPRVVAIPFLPDSLEAVFQRHQIMPVCLEEVPHPADLKADVVFVDLASCSARELLYAETISQRCLTIGFASEPIPSGGPSPMPVFYPQDIEGLTRQLAHFLAAVERWEPGVPLTFQVQLRTGNTQLSAVAESLAADTCILSAAEKLDAGTVVDGIMEIPAAPRTFAFRGQITAVYPLGEHYELVVRFRPQPEAVSSFRTFYQRCLSHKLQIRLRALLQSR